MQLSDISGKFKIGTRIYAGFGAVLALLILVAGAGILSLGSARLMIGSYAEISGSTQAISRIKANFLDVRRGVRTFVENNDAQQKNKIVENLDVVRKDLAEVASKASSSEDKDKLSQMQKLAESYQQNFAKVPALLDKARDLQLNGLGKIGAKVLQNYEEVIRTAMAEGDNESAAHAGIAAEKMLQVRLSVWRYDADTTPENLQAQEVALSQFLEVANKLEGKIRGAARKALAREVVVLMDEYQLRFKEFVAARAEQSRLVNSDMAVAGVAFSDDADALVVSSGKELTRIEDNLFATINASITMAFVISLTALGLGAFAAWVIASGIVKPVRATTDIMGQLAANNLKVEVAYAEQSDEIGEMARSVRHFKDQLIRVKQLEAEQEEQKRRSEAERLAAMRKMADNFEASVGGVIGTVTSAATQLQSASSQMAGTATETSTQATTVASAAQQASANVQTVASATEELASSIREISKQVDRSQAVSAKAKGTASMTTERIQDLSSKVSQIGEVIDLINDIASQTNLLALNATIEAARAGDAGKGFAVVASEVKGLANQTAKATEDIAAQIKAVQDVTGSAVGAISEIVGVISEISEISSAVAAAVQEQSAATDEIARNVEQASTGTQEVSSNISSVEQAAKETGGAAEQIKISATDLSKQAEYLRIEVGRFLAQVRAEKKDVQLMAWRDDFLTGVASIDDYHKELFVLMNDFYREMMSGDAGMAALAVLAKMEREFKSHFEDEEKHMVKSGFAEAEEHRRAHMQFAERFPELRRCIEAGSHDATSKLFAKLTEWWERHICVEDHKLALHLRQRKVA